MSIFPKPWKDGYSVGFEAAKSIYSKMVEQLRADLQAQQSEDKDEAIRKLSEALRLSWSKMYVSGVEARRLSDEALQLPIVRAIAGEPNAKP